METIDLWQLHRIDAKVPREEQFARNRYNLGDRAAEDVLRYCEAHGSASSRGSRSPPEAEPSPAVPWPTSPPPTGPPPDRSRWAWLLHRSPVILPIPGTGSIEHLEENVAAAGLHLGEGELATLDRAVRRPLLRASAGFTPPASGHSALTTQTRPRSRLMTQSNQKVVQYLNEAHASEVGLTRVLQSQIAMTPRGTYRTGLEKHLEETRDHAERVERRLGELDAGQQPAAGRDRDRRGLAGPDDRAVEDAARPLRGSGGEEKVFKNAKDAAATEALEIATYTGLERSRRAVGRREDRPSSPHRSAPTRSGCSSACCARFPSSPTRSSRPRSRATARTT